MTSRGAVPGSAVVKQEENISREVSQGPRKREEQHTGPLFPSMQRRSEKEGVPPPTLNVAIYVFKQRDFTFDLLWSTALEPNCFNLWV